MQFSFFFYESVHVSRLIRGDRSREKFRCSENSTNIYVHIHIHIAYIVHIRSNKLINYSYSGQLLSRWFRCSFLPCFRTYVILTVSTFTLILLSFFSFLSFLSSSRHLFLLIVTRLPIDNNRER